MRIILTLILVFYILSPELYAITIKGNSLLWSTDDNEEFLFAFTGKTEGKKIWKIYNIKENLSVTLTPDIGLTPKWSPTGKNILIAEKNYIHIFSSPESKKTYKTVANEILNFDFNINENLIIYSDRLKIYLLDLQKNENSFLTYGSSPYFIDEKNIIFLDDSLKLSLLDNELNKKILLDENITKFFPLKNNKSIVFQDTDLNKIKIFNIQENKAFAVIEEKDEITDFSVSQDEEFLIYIVNNSELFIAHIKTRQKIPILKEKDIFSPGISKNNSYLSYEKSGQIIIENASKFINSFELDKIFKVNIGSKDGITLNDKLEVYEERRNLEGKIIGMDYNIFKGVLKIITIYDDYSYAKLDEEYKTDLKIEINDIAYWKEKDITAIISK